MTATVSAQPAPPTLPPPPSRGGKALGALIAVLIIATAVGTGWWLLRTGPKARKKRRLPKTTWLVKVQAVVFAAHRARVVAMGTVQAAKQVDLRARVGGQIIALNQEMVPGGRFRQGQWIAKIDPRDFALAIKQRKSAVVQAQTVLALERGQQAVAKRGYQLLGQKIADKDRALVLRRPQLESARATLQAAEALLAQAKLDLTRTIVRAPFNALVQTRTVSLGTQVSALTSLGQLVGTDEYWVEVSVPVGELRWIDIPRRSGDKGSAARIYHPSAWGPGVHREARVFRLGSDLEAKGRMARLLLTVPDPLLLQAPRSTGHGRTRTLLIGSYVRAEILGGDIGRVAVIPPRALRDGKTVWLAGPDDKLEIRPVQVTLRGPQRVYVGSGLRAGERLVVSELSSPVAGMPLRVVGAKPTKAP